MTDDRRERVAAALRNELWARRKGNIDLLHEDAGDIADAVLAALAERTEGEQTSERRHEVLRLMRKHARLNADEATAGQPYRVALTHEQWDIITAALAASPVPPQEAGEPEWIVEVRDPAIGGWREKSKRVSRERAEEIARLWRPGGVSGLRVRIVPLLRGTPVEIRGDV